MVWWFVFAEIYLVVDYLGLIHVLSNLDLKLYKGFLCVLVWFGGWAHKENIESKRFKIYLNNFSC